MRMRRKKHLDDRMEACDDLMINMLIGNRHFGATEEQHLLDLPALFGRERPVELEIGCGKGGFICELAAAGRRRIFLLSRNMAMCWLPPARPSGHGADQCPLPVGGCRVPAALSARP